MRYFSNYRDGLNAKMKSTLFHATTSPNGGRSSRREYFISTQPRIRYVATHNCDERESPKKIVSLKRQADYREQDRFPHNPLPFIVTPSSFYSFPLVFSLVSIPTSVETKSRGKLGSLFP